MFVMTVDPHIVYAESAPAGVAVSGDRPARRLSNQPIAVAAAAHAALFIVASIAMMTLDYITVAHRLYLAFLTSGLVAWGGLLAVGLAGLAVRRARQLSQRESTAREDARLLGRLAAV
jgi:hypothetical protein